MRQGVEDARGFRIEADAQERCGHRLFDVRREGLSRIRHGQACGALAMPRFSPRRCLAMYGFGSQFFHEAAAVVLQFLPPGFVDSPGSRPATYGFIVPQ